ncbi:MAG: D-alanyl-D-alanine carboxypeptidase [Rhodospirillales bacterium]|nr:D-alanyl-D-alanine carboxypeptidase [Rhodospirillales bacterium]
MTLFVFVLTLFVVSTGFHTDAWAEGNPKYASIVMDADTGLILYQRYADKSLHPASLTKVMTLLLTFEALEQGRISLNDRVRISNHAANMVPSKLGLSPGSSIRVKDAIYALVTKSANDVAVALAEHLAGSERNFAQRMTNKAQEIGMTRTRFVNASGLHDTRQVSTARDMAKMARYVIQVHPDYYRYFSRKNFTYNGNTYRNHNRLMDTYSGMDGMKTGYVAASGFNLIASAMRGDRRLIGVVFGGRSSKTRNEHMKELLDAGFGKIKDLRVAKAQVPLPTRKPAIAQAYAALSSPAIQRGFERLIGEGDSDPASSRRIETGLMAIAAHTGETPSAYNASPEIRLASTAPQAESHYQAPSVTSGTPEPVLTNHRESWSVQIGAFTSRAATDQAIQKTLKKLPYPYSKAQPTIAPLRTADGWLFRARLSGYTKNEAIAACDFIRDCLPVAPQN